MYLARRKKIKIKNKKINKIKTKTKTTPYSPPKKVETYSSSNAVALNLEEKVSYITYVTGKFEIQVEMIST